jgi:hypothetical protein
MNITELATEALELTVAYFHAHYDINQTNAEEASQKIAKYFVANADQIVRAVIAGKKAAL